MSNKDLYRRAATAKPQPSKIIQILMDDRWTLFGLDDNGVVWQSKRMLGGDSDSFHNWEPVHE